MFEVVVGRGDAAEAIVLYDHDCGFCRWTLGLLLMWDRRRRLWPAPIVGAVGDRWLAGMPVEERLASWHLVEAAGRVSSAGAGLAVVASYVPGGGLVSPLLRRAPAAVERGYRFVADHRSGFSWFVPGWAVRRATARVERRAGGAPPAWA
jgi:predicted DCC family thiol-disulfide oxidoreductase YuxK